MLQINEKLLNNSGEILWVNQSDGNIFNSQKINVNLKGCKWFKIIYKTNKSDNEYLVQEIPFPNIAIRTTCTTYGKVAQKDVTVARSCNVDTNGNFSFGQCIAYGIRGDSYVNTEQNDMMIPIRIVGYRSSWNIG